MDLSINYTALKITTAGADKARGLFEIWGKNFAVVSGGLTIRFSTRSEQSIVLWGVQAREKLIYVPHI